MRFALCFFAALNLFSKTGVVKVIIRKQVYVGIIKVPTYTCFLIAYIMNAVSYVCLFV